MEGEGESHRGREKTREGRPRTSKQTKIMAQGRGQTNLAIENGELFRTIGQRTLGKLRGK